VSSGKLQELSLPVVGKAVLTLYPPPRPLSHNVNPRDGRGPGYLWGSSFCDGLAPLQWLCDFRRAMGGSNERSGSAPEEDGGCGPGGPNGVGVIASGQAVLARPIPKSEAHMGHGAWGAGPYFLFTGGPWSPKQGRRPVAIKARHARRIRGKKVL
jgi:hypothetical protein